MKYITFALAKGRLAKQAMKLLNQVGITWEVMEDPDDSPRSDIGGIQSGGHRRGWPGHHSGGRAQAL